MPSDSTELTASILAGIIIASLILTLLFVILVSYIKRRLIHSREIMTMQAIYEQELLKTRLEIQEQTFATISQEIHDNIGQALSFIKLNLNTVDADNPVTVREKLDESKKLLTKSIQDLRDLSRTINTDYISEIGLSVAIEQQLLLLQKTGLFKTSFSEDGGPYKLQVQQELVTFRIVQELLNNIVKHAEATEVSIQLAYTKDILTLKIQDDGKGFDLNAVQAAPGKHGIGIKNMMSRIAMINGKINIASQCGVGTCATICLPGTNKKLLANNTVTS